MAAAAWLGRILRIGNVLPHLMDVLDDEWKVPVVGVVGGLHEVLMGLRVQQTHTVELAFLSWSQEQLGAILGELTGLSLGKESRHD